MTETFKEIPDPIPTVKEINECEKILRHVMRRIIAEHVATGHRINAVDVSRIVINEKGRPSYVRGKLRDGFDTTVGDLLKIYRCTSGKHRGRVDYHISGLDWGGGRAGQGWIDEVAILELKRAKERIVV